MKETEHLAYQEEVAEEINNMTGLKAEIKDNAIEVDTIAGKIRYKAIDRDLMKAVYGFLYRYGMNLSTYARLERIKLINKH